jgi:protein phosphatase
MQIRLAEPIFLTKPGKRPYNEDFVYPDKSVSESSVRSTVFLVCDGVGGAEKGEVASRLVGEDMYASLSGLPSITDSAIQSAIENAQDRIDAYISSHGVEQTMATTMTLVCFDNEGAVMAHIGDSRIYHIRDREICYRSEDHSLVNELISQNLISPDEAKNHPQKNVITKAISGKDHAVRATLKRTSDILPGDIFFLCTDGVLESVDDSFLIDLLCDKSNLNHRKVDIIDSRCAIDSKDNYSLYLIQIEAVD